MAIIVNSRDDVDIILTRQTAWGTATADSAAGTILDVETATIDPDFNVHTPNRSNSGSRVLQDFNINVDASGVSPKLALSGDVKQKDLAHFLYGVIQGLTSEGAVTPFQKVLTFPATQPDFTAITTLASPGWIGTIIEKHPAASTSSKISDAICTDLTLTCAPDSGDGRMKMKATMVGRGTMSTLANPTGTYTRVAQEFFNFHDLVTFTLNGQPLIPLAIEIKISQPKTKGVSVDQGTNKFKTFAIPEYDVTAKIRTIDDSNARSHRNEWGTSVNYSWVITWGATGVAGYLNFVMQMALVRAPRIIEDVNAIEFDLRGVKSGTTPALTVTLADAVDRGWI